MDSVFYYEYCPGILAVRTNIRDFSWVYGSAAPCTDVQTFNSCKLKFCIERVADGAVAVPAGAERFQCFFWDGDTLYYSRKITGVRLAWSARVQGDTVSVKLGAHYHRLLRHRVMNLHAAYYLLADLANILLLKSGYATLYCAALRHIPSGRTAAVFAPPGTGKTLTATTLAQRPQYRLVAEDVAVTDGEKIYGCPWTNSYRSAKASALDSGGAGGRKKRAKDIPGFDTHGYALTDVVLLRHCPAGQHMTPAEAKKRIDLLNGYLFGGFASPVISAYACFCGDESGSYAARAAKIMQKTFAQGACHVLCSSDPAEFAGALAQALESGGGNHETK